MSFAGRGWREEVSLAQCGSPCRQVAQRAVAGAEGIETPRTAASAECPSRRTQRSGSYCRFGRGAEGESWPDERPARREGGALDRVELGLRSVCLTLIHAGVRTVFAGKV
jgi:hypothetical protein